MADVLLLGQTTRVRLLPPRTKNSGKTTNCCHSSFVCARIRYIYLTFHCRRKSAPTPVATTNEDEDSPYGIDDVTDSDSEHYWDDLSDGEGGGWSSDEDDDEYDNGRPKKPSCWQQFKYHWRTRTLPYYLVYVDYLFSWGIGVWLSWWTILTIANLLENNSESQVLQSTVLSVFIDILISEPLKVSSTIILILILILSLTRNQPYCIFYPLARRFSSLL